MLARLVQRVCGIAGPTLTRHALSALPRTRRVARVAGVIVGAPTERQSAAPQVALGSDVAKPKAGECKSGCKFGSELESSRRAAIAISHELAPLSSG